jgi:antitoxin component YwqK of YwqJK toxin-antitoxin module
METEHKPKKDGFYLDFFNNKNRRLECFYKDGLLDGVYKEWHKNGRLRISATFKDGKLDESFKLFTKNGKKLYYFRFNEGNVSQGFIWFENFKYNPNILDQIVLDKKLIEW